MTDEDVLAELVTSVYLTPRQQEALRRFFSIHGFLTLLGPCGAGPEYLKDVERLVEVARRWGREHPAAVLVFDVPESTFIVASLGDVMVRAQIARSDDALALLEYMESETGGEMTIMQAVFALSYLGVIR